MVGRFWSVCEDAFITFRYSRNLANGLGARYNLGDQLPVEGYSNFLWMLIAAGFEFVGLDVTFWMPLISFGTGLWLLWMLLHTMHARLGMSLTVTGLAGAVFALFSPVAVWTTTGLATMPQSALMFAAFIWLAYGDGRKDALIAGGFALLLALVRTEGVAWAVVLAGCAAVSLHLRGQNLKRPLAGYFGLLITTFSLYFAWRYSYYDKLFSNTAHAKVDLSAQSIARGIQYVSYYGILMLTPLAMIPACFVATFGKRRAHGVAFAALSVGVPMYALLVSGDYMAYFRMMVPGVAFMVVTLAFFYEWALERFTKQLPVITSFAAAIALFGALPGYDIILAPERLINSVQTRLIKFESLERDLAWQGLRIADRDEYLFGFGRPFHLRNARNEYERWSHMKNHPLKWKAEAQAVLQLIEPGERIVTGAIGVFGYFSEVPILDQNGLIDGKVDTRKDRKFLRWPGHDKYVVKTYFLKDKAEILEHRVFFGSEAQFKIAQAGNDFDKANLRKWYYPEVKRVQVDWPIEPAYVVFQRRAKTQAAAVEGWKRFEDRWGQKRASKRRSGGRHKSTRQREGEVTAELPGGRWRTFTDNSELSATELEDLKLLEAIGYVSGTVEATEPLSGVTVHDVERTQPGHMLYTSGHRPLAVLTNLDGKVLHRWNHRFNDIWPDYPVEKDHLGRSYWRRAYLQPDGMLLAIYEGLGMVKLDKNSKLVWETANRAHHDLDIAENGDIFSLTRVARVIKRINQKKPLLEDYVTVLDPNGEEKYSISLLEAFERSGFDDIWRSDGKRKDIFHTNSIRILDGSIADRVPEFKKGNILLSMRTVSALAVLDIDQEKIVWAVKGDFETQHDPKILPNGNMLLFNNSESEYSSVLEIDPATMKTVWSYQGGPEQPFKTKFCGLSDRLPNGNTLIVESEPGRAFEVTSDGETVWEFHTPHRAGPDDQYVASLLQTTRLLDADLSWLESVERKEKSKDKTEPSSSKGSQSDDKDKRQQEDAKRPRKKGKE